MEQARHRAFSLVELLVVIAIIGTLSSIAVLAISNAREKGRNVKRVADVRQIVMSLELYNNDYNGYPTELSAVTLGSGAFSSLCAGGFKTACGSGEDVFQGIVPTAPTPWDGTCSEGDNDYSYSTPGGGEFQIEFCLGESVGDLVAGVHIANPSGIQ
ncbi:MAG: type II secretion system protein [Patescibacteria group bacterium]|nr:type II secretion system protein [Patescibacteria group bacterium]